eukprot:TRINITY_DN20829_c3_g1_i1.p1 TRINITY_DN20829_c3_g1~~TRINITY_DN20829_c3_g1_i1.p1  ORF type:complete len:333 (-),score=45.50 TRINITY_DN20829_c3_g1_i1:94-1092(-)
MAATTTSSIKKWKSQGAIRPPGTPSATYKERPHPTASFGVFISRNAIEPVKGEDLKKFQFTRRSDIEFKKKSLNKAERGENLLTLYEPGSHWENYQPPEALPFHKSSCSYSKEFPVKPNLDYLDNKALNQLFRPGASKQAPDLAGFGPRTTYENFHVGAFGADLKKFKTPPNNPKGVEGDVLGGVGGMMETTPVSQNQFQAREIKYAGPIHPVEAIHTKSREHMLPEHGQCTRYKLDFGPELAHTTPPNPLARPIRPNRCASLGAVGGPPYQRLEHMAKVQGDYLIATRSGCRGFGHDPKEVDANATGNRWLKGKSSTNRKGKSRDPFRETV